jgi:flagellin
MSVSLSFGSRNSLNSLSDINSALEVANKRLATGKKVNSAIDNAQSFFAAQNFSKEASDLGNLVEAQQLGLNFIDKQVKTLDAGVKLIDSAKELFRRALTSTSSTDRNALAAQGAQLLSQFINLTRDSGFNGRNGLVGDTDTVSVNATATLNVAATGVVGGALGTAQLEVRTSTAAVGFTSVRTTAIDTRLGAANTGTGLGLAIAANTGLKVTTPNTATAFVEANATTTFDVGGAQDTLINNFITAATTASASLQARASVLSTQASVLQIRQQFTKDTARINSSSADTLTLADINEEGAALQTLQTRQSLAVSSLGLANRADQAILRLFG